MGPISANHNKVFQLKLKKKNGNTTTHQHDQKCNTIYDGV